jgi:AcrR family transcriptional regulator
MTEAGARSASAQRVLAAALDLFTEQGFEGTSLQQIADRLGVTKAAVYYHFRSKDDLLDALVAPALADLSALLDEAGHAARESGRAKLALRGYLDHLLRHRATAAWLSRDLAALARTSAVRTVQDVEGRLGRLLTGCDDPLARLWSAAVLRGLGAAVLSQPDAPEDWLRAQLEELSEHLLSGYRAARRRCPVAVGPAPVAEQVAAR